MKIDQNGILPSTAGLENNSPAAETVARQKNTGPASPVQDQTQFSSLGTTASQLRTRLNTVPEVRQERVNYYQQKISSGTYKVDAQSVASRMLQESGISPVGN